MTAIYPLPAKGDNEPSLAAGGGNKFRREGCAIKPISSQKQGFYDFGGSHKTLCPVRIGCNIVYVIV
jgi:hypothetical protein